MSNQWNNKPLPHSRKLRNKAKSLGVAAKRENMTKLLTLWEPDFTCTEYGWDLETLH